jgi:hypothetical protein
MDAGERLRWDIDGTVQFILARQCRCIALQMPDGQLADSDAVYHTLLSELVAAGQPAQVREGCNSRLFNFQLAGPAKSHRVTDANMLGSTDVIVSFNSQVRPDAR